MNIKHKLALCTGCHGSGETDVFVNASGKRFVVFCTCGKSGSPMSDTTGAIDHWNMINGRLSPVTDEHGDTDFTGQYLLPAILRRQAS